MIEYFSKRKKSQFFFKCSTASLAASSKQSALIILNPLCDLLYSSKICFPNSLFVPESLQINVFCIWSLSAAWIIPILIILLILHILFIFASFLV